MKFVYSVVKLNKPFLLATPKQCLFPAMRSSVFGTFLAQERHLERVLVEVSRLVSAKDFYFS